MKYVRFYNPATRDSTFRFAFGMVQHSRLAAEVVPAGFVPKSAGYVRFIGDRAETFGESTSLNLVPAENDAAVITAFYRATQRTAQTSSPVPA